MHRKQAHQGVLVEYPEPVELNGIRFDENGNPQFLKDGKPLSPESAWTYRSRERDNLTKPEKMLFRAPIDPMTLVASEPHALKQYDHIFAIDTNTKEIAGPVVSIACFAECRLTVEQDEWSCSIELLGAYEFHNGPVGKTENFAWHLLIRAIQENPEFAPAQQIAIITDSDLGNHDAYNKRQKPYFGCHFLPKGFYLAYAFDKDQGICSQAIKLCDKAANQIRDIIDARRIMDCGYNVANGYCSFIRGWSIEDESTVTLGKWSRLGKPPNDAPITQAERP